MLSWSLKPNNKKCSWQMVSDEGMHFHLSVFIQFPFPFLQRWWYRLLRSSVQKTVSMWTQVALEMRRWAASRVCACAPTPFFFFLFLSPSLLSSLEFSFTSLPSLASANHDHGFTGPLYVQFPVSLDGIRRHKRSQPGGYIWAFCLCHCGNALIGSEVKA